MSGKTALITGALGQDGTLLSEWLTSSGYRVVGVVREAARAAAHARENIELIAADLCDPAVVRNLLDRYQPDEIYHLAAHHHSSQEGASGAQLAAKRLMVQTSFNIAQSLA